MTCCALTLCLLDGAWLIAIIAASLKVQAVFPEPFFLQHSHLENVPPLALAPELLSPPSFFDEAYVAVAIQCPIVRRVETELDAMIAKGREDVIAHPT